MKDPLEPIEEYPPISVRIVELLDRQFPVRLPAVDGNERSDVYHAGARQVVEFLRQVREDQLERAREQRG